MIQTLKWISLRGYASLSFINGMVTFGRVDDLGIHTILSIIYFKIVILDNLNLSSYVYVSD